MRRWPPHLALYRALQHAPKDVVHDTVMPSVRVRLGLFRLLHLAALALQLTVLQGRMCVGGGVEEPDAWLGLRGWATCHL